MKKKILFGHGERYCIRKLQKAVPDSACLCHEVFTSSFELAQCDFDFSLMNSRKFQLIQIELLEIRDDDLYYPILSVKLDWF